jgi:hypothetical protein
MVATSRKINILARKLVIKNARPKAMGLTDSVGDKYTVKTRIDVKTKKTVSAPTNISILKNFAKKSFLALTGKINKLKKSFLSRNIFSQMVTHIIPIRAIIIVKKEVSTCQGSTSLATSR